MIQIEIKPQFKKELESALLPKRFDDPSCCPVILFRASERKYRIFGRFMNFIAEHPEWTEIRESLSREPAPHIHSDIRRFLEDNELVAKHYSATFDLSEEELSNALHSPDVREIAGYTFRSSDLVSARRKFLTKHCSHVNIDILDANTSNLVKYKQINRPSSKLHVISFGFRIPLGPDI